MAAGTQAKAGHTARELHRSCDADEVRLGEFEIVAAGAIPWRATPAGVEVLLIHRPKYDDWSWPKGKLDEGESIAECAVREVREETGLRITLGQPLEATPYAVKGKPKIVYYWAAKIPLGTEPVPDGGECDQVRWLPAEQAAELLSNASDAAPLRALSRAADAGTLDTQPFLLVRHAKAKPRGKWTRAEGERPLAATGRRQAQSVSRMLEAWSPSHVASSPWMRCVQTVAPYLQLHEKKFKPIPAITEHAANRNPERAMKAFVKLLKKPRAQAVCTHRPVLPLALRMLAKFSSTKVSRVLPAADPFLEPGGVIVAHRMQDGSARIVSLEVHTPYHD